MTQRLSITSALLTLAALLPMSASAVTIAYGTVTHVKEVKEHDNVASGAVVGGLLGAIAGPRRPGLNRGVVAGAAAGAAVDASDQDSHFVYTVELVTSDESVDVSTEQDDIREGDCVSFERGAHANIRRVGSVHCDQQTATPPDHHAEMAGQCDQAKQELLAAETNEEVDIAVQKVRVLCED